MQHWLAYLDPGLGAMILSAVVGIAATVALGARMFWHALLAPLRGRSGATPAAGGAAPAAVSAGTTVPVGADADADAAAPASAGFLRCWRDLRRFRALDRAARNIVIYAESSQDWHHFEPIVLHLTRDLGKQVCYVSSDAADAERRGRVAGVRAFCIGKGLLRMLLFRTLQAEVCVLTMTDLHTLQLKRSLHPVHYVYVFHGMGSTHMVDLEGAYDHYDSVFCVGPHQVREIRRREELAKLPAKHLFEHGYGRLDRFLRLAPQLQREPGNPPTVLIAPTWGVTTILHRCGRELVRALLDAGMNVVLRPHYQTRLLAPETIDSLAREFGGDPRFSLVERMGEEDSLFRSDVLVTDWSSIALEYALGLGKPVLFVDVPPRVRNPRYEELGIAPVEKEIRARVGTILDPARVAEAPAAVAALVAGTAGFRARLPELRKDYVFNVGSSAEAAARELARLAGGARP
jgi:YidC/Oxa1 family membrane protein insertase